MPSSPDAGGDWRTPSGSGRQSRPSSPARSCFHLSAPCARRPGRAPLLRLWGLRASRQGGGRAGDLPSALAEPVSADAPPIREEKTGPPKPSSWKPERPSHRARDGDSSVTRGAGPQRAEAGAGSGRGAPSGKWGLPAAGAWETVSVVLGPRRQR